MVLQPSLHEGRQWAAWGHWGVQLAEGHSDHVRMNGHPSSVQIMSLSFRIVQVYRTSSLRIFVRGLLNTDLKCRKELGSYGREACLALRLLQCKRGEPPFLSNWEKFIGPNTGCVPHNAPPLLLFMSVRRSYCTDSEVLRFQCQKLCAGTMRICCALRQRRWCRRVQRRRRKGWQGRSCRGRRLQQRRCARSSPTPWKCCPPCLWRARATLKPPTQVNHHILTSQCWGPKMTLVWCFAHVQVQHMLDGYLILGPFLTCHCSVQLEEHLKTS